MNEDQWHCADCDTEGDTLESAMLHSRTFDHGVIYAPREDNDNG